MCWDASCVLPLATVVYHVVRPFASSRRLEDRAAAARRCDRLEGPRP